MADHLGSLDIGKTANVVVGDGDPLFFIEGRAVAMTSRQTVLRDRYSGR